MENVRREIIRFGINETYNLYMYSIADHHKSCLSINTTESDSTGTRLYAGGHVGIRFIRYLLNSASCNHIFDTVESLRVIELGCGVGIVSLLSFLPRRYFLSDRISKIILTDGFSEVAKIAELNYNTIKSEYSGIINDNIEVLTEKLQWGNKENIIQLIDSVNDGKNFDIVIGTDLMYYNVNVTELLDTVLALILPDGIMIHAHHFRVDGTKRKVIDYFTAIGWNTLEISIEEFIESNELINHPEWYKVNVCISACNDKIQLLQTQHPNWRIFNSFDEEEDDVNDKNFKFPEL